ncbi:MAG: hypothetical protein H7Y59_08580 [Anaerolineales bacterium]|nr:hypothetical protein [Anaerolineales bacterium]
MLSFILTSLIVLYFTISGSKIDIFTEIVWILLLYVSINELIKAILIVAKNQVHYVLAAQIGFFFIKLFPTSSERQNALMKDYKENMKMYALFTLIGAPFFIWIVISELMK